jgi:transposase
MLQAIIAGQEDPTALAEFAKGRMRPKIDALEQALTGRVRDSHRFLLRMHLEHIDELNAKIAQLDQAIDQRMPPFDPEQLVERLDAIPGVGPITVQIVIAELGLDMSRFPTHAHAASWAGLAPGKNESGGRNHSARTLKANRYLRAALVEAAHAAGKTATYLGEKYRRLARRRGKKRAAVAVARTLLTIIYHMISQGTKYVERGSTYFDQLNPPATQQWLTRRLEKLGFRVTLEPLPMAA